MLPLVRFPFLMHAAALNEFNGAIRKGLSFIYGSKKYMGWRGWRCDNQHSGKTDCKMPTPRDEDIEAAFVAAFNQAIDHKDEIMNICLEVMAQRATPPT